METGRGGGNARVQQLIAKVVMIFGIVALQLATIVYLFINVHVALFLAICLVVLIVATIHVATSVLEVHENHAGIVYHNNQRITQRTGDILTEGSWWFLGLLFGKKVVHQISLAIKTIDGEGKFITKSDTEVKVKYQIEWRIFLSGFLQVFLELMDGKIDIKKVEWWLKEKFDRAASQFFASKEIGEVMPSLGANLNLQAIQDAICVLALAMMRSVGIEIVGYTIAEIDYADSTVAEAASESKKAELRKRAAKVAGQAEDDRMRAIYGSEWDRMTPDQKIRARIAESSGGALDALIKGMAATSGGGNQPQKGGNRGGGNRR